MQERTGPTGAHEPRVLASGLRALEGPVYLGAGEVVFTEKVGQRITRYADGVTSVVATTAGAPNGATLGSDGTIWIANNGGLELGPDGYWFAEEFVDGYIERVAPDGGTENVSGHLPGGDPHRPNDLCFGPDGKLYFTDPRNWDDFANFKVGRIWRLDPETGAAESLADFPHFCNGIAFGPDASRLYVAQSNTMKMFEFEWNPSGLGERREWATLPAGFPDGFCFSAEGDCFVCGSMGDVIQVFDADGALKSTITLPQRTFPTNCCLGDGILYVTGAHELLAFDVGTDALPLFPFR